MPMGNVLGYWRCSQKVLLSVVYHWKRDEENFKEETRTEEGLPGQRYSVSKARKVLTARAAFESSLGVTTATDTHFLQPPFP